MTSGARSMAVEMPGRGWRRPAIDRLGRTTAQTDASGQTGSTLYTANGQVLANIDTYGNRTTFIYDSADRLIATKDPFGGIATTV
jgi:YD repeat-containing protein